MVSWLSCGPERQFYGWFITCTFFIGDVFIFFYAFQTLRLHQGEARSRWRQNAVSERERYGGQNSSHTANGLSKQMVVFRGNINVKGSWESAWGINQKRGVYVFQIFLLGGCLGLWFSHVWAFIWTVWKSYVFFFFSYCSETAWKQDVHSPPHLRGPESSRPRFCQGNRCLHYTYRESYRCRWESIVEIKSVWITNIHCNNR